MPVMCLPIRTAGIRSLPALMLILMGAALSGCSGGDFGRTRGDFKKRSTLHDGYRLKNGPLRKYTA